MARRRTRLFLSVPTAIALGSHGSAFASSFARSTYYYSVLSSKYVLAACLAPLRESQIGEQPSWVQNHSGNALDGSGRYYYYYLTSFPLLNSSMLFPSCYLYWLNVPILVQIYTHPFVA